MSNPARSPRASDSSLIDDLYEYADRVIDQFHPTAFSNPLKRQACKNIVIARLDQTLQERRRHTRDEQAARGIFTGPSLERDRAESAGRDVLRCELELYLDRMIEKALTATEAEAGIYRMPGGGLILKGGGPARDAEDPTAYLPAKEFLTEADGRFHSYSALRKALRENPKIRWKKPTRQRLLIHAGDWLKFQTPRPAADPLDLPGEPVEEVVRVVEARKAQVRRARGK